MVEKSEERILKLRAELRRKKFRPLRYTKWFILIISILTAVFLIIAVITNPTKERYIRILESGIYDRSPYTEDLMKFHREKVKRTNYIFFSIFEIPGGRFYQKHHRVGVFLQFIRVS
jgi:hypothetical protein